MFSGNLSKIYNGTLSRFFQSVKIATLKVLGPSLSGVQFVQRLVGLASSLSGA